MENMGIDVKIFQYIAHSIEETPFYKLLGIELLRLGPGWAEMGTTTGPDHSNPLGVVHGGVYMTLADAAMGNAVRSLGISGVTVDCSTALITAMPFGEKVWARGEVLRAGRTLIFAQAKVYSGERLLADGKGTFYGTGNIKID